MPTILRPTKLAWLAQSPNTSTLSTPLPQGSMAGWGEWGLARRESWILARLIAGCDWTVLWEHTHTHTAYRQHTPYPAHVCTLTHGHTYTRCRYHPSACSLPDEHLHPPRGAVPLSPGSRDLASGPQRASFMWARGIISLYVCVYEWLIQR